ncbi:hypothetical protein Pmani_001672 [Petrolisthes manimaculis]|uniref:Uncharacterized protein n=1 Tax=Petrolisthes manimaculis TaxID=1843537 RepID=A0AAE1QK66_9EUCA|nr:hypothetical protein Pmani_001672 [Petrolisthes manimaculis]
MMLMVVKATASQHIMRQIITIQSMNIMKRQDGVKLLLKPNTQSFPHLDNLIHSTASQICPTAVMPCTDIQYCHQQPEP